jgi:predicted HAD superfamily phosphohydrolase YqeG
MRVRMMVLSNSVKQGDPSFAAGIPILFTEERKPFNEGEVRRAIGSIPYDRVWIVGDRLMTDIYLANKIGIRSALVPPVEESSIEKHGLGTWGLRWL